MAQITESDYETAQQGNARVRQEFLDAVDFEYASEFVGKVKYDKISEGKTLATTSFLTFFGFPMKKPNIKVFPGLFNQRFQYSLSVLIDHEGYHAMHFVEKSHTFFPLVEKYGAGLSVGSRYLDSLKEILAYTNQLQEYQKRNLSGDELERLYDLLQHRILLGLKFSRDLESDLKLMYCSSPRDTLSRERMPEIISKVSEIVYIN